MSRAGARPRGWRAAIVAVVAVTLLAGAPASSAAGSGATASRVRASPLLAALDLSIVRAQTGQTLQVKATVSNLSHSLVRRITVDLRFDPVGLKVKAATAEVAQIKAGKRVVVTWSVCGRLPGIYVLLARVTLDGVSIDSPARVLTMTAGGKKACS